MEALLYILDTVAVIIAVYMGLRDDRRPPGTPQTSVFRTRDDAVPPQDTGRPARLQGARTR